VTRKEENRVTFSVLVGIPEGKQLGKHRCGWMDNIEVDLRGTPWGGVFCIDLDQYRNKWWVVVNTTMNLRFP
jgi:hypothetical protein